MAGFLFQVDEEGITTKKFDGKDFQVEQRLDYLRGEILEERISYGEIAELQSLSEHIDKDDVLLLEWAGVPEE